MIKIFEQQSGIETMQTPGAFAKSCFFLILQTTVHTTGQVTKPCQIRFF